MSESEPQTLQADPPAATPETSKGLVPEILEVYEEMKTELRAMLKDEATKIAEQAKEETKKEVIQALRLGAGLPSDTPVTADQIPALLIKAFKENPGALREIFLSETEKTRAPAATPKAGGPEGNQQPPNPLDEAFDKYLTEETA